MDTDIEVQKMRDCRDIDTFRGLVIRWSLDRGHGLSVAKNWRHDIKTATTADLARDAARRFGGVARLCRDPKRVALFSPFLKRAVESGLPATLDMLALCMRRMAEIHEFNERVGDKS